MISDVHPPYKKCLHNGCRRTKSYVSASEIISWIQIANSIRTLWDVKMELARNTETAWLIMKQTIMRLINTHLCIWLEIWWCNILGSDVGWLTATRTALRLWRWEIERQENDVKKDDEMKGMMCMLPLCVCLCVSCGSPVCISCLPPPKLYLSLSAVTVLPSLSASLFLVLCLYPPIVPH